MQSDLAVFHRIDDIWSHPAQSVADKFIRLGAYRGVIRAIIETESQQEQNEPAPSRFTGRNGLDQDRVVDSDAHTLETDPAFQGIIEVKRSPDAGQGVQTT